MPAISPKTSTPAKRARLLDTSSDIRDCIAALSDIDYSAEETDPGSDIVQSDVDNSVEENDLDSESSGDEDRPIADPRAS